jgi:hypothetical protein
MHEKRILNFTFLLVSKFHIKQIVSCDIVLVPMLNTVELISNSDNLFLSNFLCFIVVFNLYSNVVV